MKIEISDKLIDDCKKYLNWISWSEGESVVIENLLKRKLQEYAFPGYDFDEFTKCFTPRKLLNDVIELTNKVVFEKNDEFIKTVIVIDLLNLKKYVDMYGLTKGDELILGVSDYLKGKFSNDKIYRYRGEEFVIFSHQVYKSLDLSDCKEIQLKYSIAKINFKIKETPINFNVSDHLVEKIDYGIKKSNIKGFKYKINIG